jgi:hypothetical protein
MAYFTPLLKRLVDLRLGKGRVGPEQHFLAQLLILLLRANSQRIFSGARA